MQCGSVVSDKIVPQLSCTVHGPTKNTDYIVLPKNEKNLKNQTNGILESVLVFHHSQSISRSVYTQYFVYRTHITVLPSHVTHTKLEYTARRSRRTYTHHCRARGQSRCYISPTRQGVKKTWRASSALREQPPPNRSAQRSSSSLAPSCPTQGRRPPPC